MNNDDFIKIEAQKQLVGIKILICINIAVSAIYYLFSIISFISVFIDFKNYESDLISGFLIDLISVFLGIIIFGGILAFFVITLIGLNKGYRYSMITARISLILWCFSILGLLMVLLIFWKRLNLPVVQQYLHYGYGKCIILR